MVQTQRLAPMVATAFLVANVLAQLGGSALVVARVRVDAAVAVLVAVLVAQALAYGLISDVRFMFRACSVIGGLILVLSDYWSAAASAAKKRGNFPGLPELDRGDRAAYLLVAGRVLLVGLVVSLALGGGADYSPLRLAAAAVGALLCVMVIIGFKAKTTALLLLVVLSALNIAVNGFWAYHAKSTKRDYAQYDFFQTLSVVGGFLLLVNLGPGGLSVDASKKRY